LAILTSRTSGSLARKIVTWHQITSFTRKVPLLPWSRRQQRQVRLLL
jgi:hypothetical protein